MAGPYRQVAGCRVLAADSLNYEDGSCQITLLGTPVLRSVDCYNRNQNEGWLQVVERSEDGVTDTVIHQQYVAGYGYVSKEWKEGRPCSGVATWVMLTFDQLNPGLTGDAYLGVTFS